MSKLLVTIEDLTEVFTGAEPECSMHVKIEAICKTGVVVEKELDIAISKADLDRFLEAREAIAQAIKELEVE